MNADGNTTSCLSARNVTLFIAEKKKYFMFGYRTWKQIIDQTEEKGNFILFLIGERIKKKKGNSSCFWLETIDWLIEFEVPQQRGQVAPHS